MSKKIKQSTDTFSVNAIYPLPIYEKEDDIYNRAEELPFEEEDLPTIRNRGDNLDIPGAELDDANEDLGEEDEENNYYSIGGDNHDNLEEDRG